jgi:hypothetical protein
LGEGNGDGLQDDEELYNKDMNKKEKKTNKPVEVHLLGCLLHTDAPKPNRRLW